MPLSDVSFPALLLMIGGVSAVSVLPPTSVNVSCTNVRVTVSWEYGHERPQTSFNVTVKGVAGESTRSTTDLHYDLTPFVWASEEYYMDNFYVSVTAIEGGDQSEPVESQTFTFNNVKTTDIICKLDFPPVALIAKDSGATVSFKNPFHYYRELRPALRPDAARLRFSVTTDGGDERFSCTVKEENCKHDIVFPSGEECVTLRGMLLDGIGVGQVLFRETGRICVSSSAGLHVFTLVVLLSITVLIISVATTVICKTKAWTMKTPESLQPNQREHERRYDTPSDTYMSVVRLVVDPRKNPSVDSEEENDPAENLQGRSAGLSAGGRRPSERSDQEPEAAGLISEERGTEDDGDRADVSAKTESVWMSLEEGEEERSPYDHPHVLQVDMGDEEAVMAYCER